jgi:hypothetical protein
MQFRWWHYSLFQSNNKKFAKSFNEDINIDKYVYYSIDKKLIIDYNKSNITQIEIEKIYIYIF